MPRTLLATLLLALALVAGACSSGEVDETVDDTAGAEDTVVGGSEAVDAQTEDMATEAQAADVAPDPEIDPTVAASEQAAGYSADLTLAGDQEVPGPGSEGTATAMVMFVEGEACIEGELTDVGAISMGHIHTGEAGEAGDVLLDLAITTDGDGPFDSCVELEQEIADMITAEPSGFYVNLHTEEFPDGAVRAQLR